MSDVNKNDNDSVNTGEPGDTSKEGGQDTQIPNYLEMSDEDILKLSGPVSATGSSTGEEQAEETGAKTPAQAEEGKKNNEGQGESGEEKTPAADTGKVAKDNKNKASEGEVPNDADAAAAASKEAGTEQGAKPGEAAKKEGEKEAAKETPQSEVIDYKAAYERLLAPFKANGRDIKVDSIEDAISLMQMGANYNKRMAGLKPNLKLLKMLENNQLLDPDKLSYLIDLSQKKPEAIQKLVKDSGIDPMDLSAEKASAYKPGTYAVDDREVELDTVLEELSDSPTYTQTLDVVGKKWDQASKDVIARVPQLLKVIDDHMARGIYGLISAEVEKQRMLGRLNGVSDIDAYKQVGDEFQAKGGFDHLSKKNGQAATQPAVPVVVAPKPKGEDTTLNDKRRAAAPTQGAAPSKTAAMDFNPLAMSDEEIMKMAAPRFK